MVRRERQQAIRPIGGGREQTDGTRESLIGGAARPGAYPETPAQIRQMQAAQPQRAKVLELRARRAER